MTSKSIQSIVNEIGVCILFYTLFCNTISYTLILFYTYILYFCTQTFSVVISANKLLMKTICTYLFYT